MLKITLIEVLAMYINEDTFVWIGKDWTNDRGEHFDSVVDALLLNINILGKKVKGYAYRVDGLLEIVL